MRDILSGRRCRSERFHVIAESAHHVPVGVGGALGALLRAWCTDVLGPRLPKGLPYPTLIVNVCACFLMGMALHASLGSTVRLMLCMGFLGGFSTMAAVCYESVAYFTSGKRLRCFAYLALTYAVCLAATAAGIALAQLVSV